MKKPFLVALVVVGLVVALRGLLRFLGTASVADDHLRSVMRVENGTTMLIGGAMAYLAWRSVSRSSASK